ncbi:MAG TPA: hypothetical protein VMT34_07280 [Aggregatilineales bacterium]|nr:hypothetical protein [Aggregatilineales bacterium]
MKRTGRKDQPSRKPIRVQIANLSGVMAEIVGGAIRLQPDLILVGVNSPATTLSNQHIDVLVLGLSKDGLLPAIYRDLWHTAPDLKIVALSANNEVTLYWLDIHLERSFLPTRDSLMEVIRYAPQHGFADSTRPGAK